jgi:hypothetical protein
MVPGCLRTQFPGSQLPRSRAVYIRPSAIPGFFKAHRPFQVFSKLISHSRFSQSYTITPIITRLPVRTRAWRPMMLPSPSQRWRQCFSPQCGVTSSSTTIPNPCRHACFMLSQHTSTTLHPMHVFLCGQSEMFHAYFSWSGHRTQGYRKV